MAILNTNNLPDDTDAHAHQILSILPVGALRKETLLTLLAFLGAAALDAAVNWRTVGSTISLNEFGAENGETVLAVGFSLLTVLAWLAVGAVFAAGFRRAALGVYLVVVSTIAYLIAPLASSLALERWASLGFDPSTLAFWQQAVGLALLTMLVSLPGLFLCACEQRLVALWSKWGIRADVLELVRLRTEASVILKTRDAVALNLQERKRSKEADIAAVVQQVEQDIDATRQSLAAEAKGQKYNVRLNKAARQSASDREHAIGLVKGFGVVLALALLTSAPAWANRGDDLMQKAPTLLILLDNTGGSPALEPSMIPHIEKWAFEKLVRLPLASSVIVFSVGDPKQIPEVKRWRVQSRITENGGTVIYLKHALHTYLQNFPARQHPENHKESHLIQGWFDAAQLLNRKADPENSVLFVTDALEFSPLANCYKACALPKPTFKLTNTDLLMLGIGFGQSSDKTLAIFEEWKKFFTAAGVPNTQLFHIF